MVDSLLPAVRDSKEWEGPNKPNVAVEKTHQLTHQLKPLPGCLHLVMATWYER